MRMLDTVVGEENLNNSLDSSAIISFKESNNLMKVSREDVFIPEVSDNE